MKKIFYLDESIVRMQLIYGLSNKEICDWWDVPEKFLQEFVKKKNLEKFYEEGLTHPDEECKVCSSCGLKKHVLKFQKKRNQCHVCIRKKKNTRHYKIVREILQSQGRDFACEECGYDKNLSALQFHHRDEKEKS